MLNDRARNLILYAKRRYPHSENTMKEVALIAGHYAGVDADSYEHPYLARLVADDLMPVIVRVCPADTFVDILGHLAPTHRDQFVASMGYFGAMVHELLQAVALRASTGMLESAGFLLGEPDPALARILQESVSLEVQAAGS